jgi:hypothetical protein
LIVLGVAEENVFGTEPFRCGLERCVSSISGCSLYSANARSGRHGNGNDLNRAQAKRLEALGNLWRHLLGDLLKPVFDNHRTDSNACALTLKGSRRGERHRIGPTRNGSQNQVPRDNAGTVPVFANGSTNIRHRWRKSWSNSHCIPFIGVVY